jgi:hypothetical protein
MNGSFAGSAPWAAGSSGRHPVREEHAGESLFRRRRGLRQERSGGDHRFEQRQRERDARRLEEQPPRHVLF